MSWPKKISFGCLTTIGIIAFLELATRFIFPLPEVQNFDRFNYAGQNKGPNNKPAPSLAQMTLWWWSEPDRAQFTRQLNLYSFRGKNWSVNKKKSRPRVLFFGDSFVEGLGVPDGDTISEQFAARAKEQGVPVESINLGAGGFGLRQYFSLMRDAVPLLHPDHVVLLLYMNDVYDVPDVEGLFGAPFEPTFKNPWSSRLLYVLKQSREGVRVPRRWHEPPGKSPRPLNVERRLGADSKLAANIEKWVDPTIAESMKAGRLNPAVTNLLNRSERILPRRIDLGPQIKAARKFVTAKGADFWLAYIPSLNQVSDAYLPEQRRISAPIQSSSLQSAKFQQHARDLKKACEESGVNFLDLTASLAAAEDRGTRLYWPFDGHMNSAGYKQVADSFFEYWKVRQE